MSGAASPLVLEQLEHRYAVERGEIPFEALVASPEDLSDVELADAIEVDARARLLMKREVTLDRYMQAVPGLAGRSEPLDTAVEYALHAMRRSGVAPAAAVEALVQRHPECSEAIRVAAELNDLFGARTTFLRTLVDETRLELPAWIGEPFGDRAGRYELRRLIAEGGQGTVYEAIDHKLSDSRYEARVAVKVLVRSLGVRSPAGELVEEALKARRLEHPNVVRVLDADVLDSGQPYVVSEYVDGPTLHQWFESRRDRLSPAQVVDMISAVADGVQAAHAAGVLHCDLKPSNVIVDRDGVPKITDFGLARVEGYGRPVGPMQNGEDERERIGTPAFMAPEQVREDPNDWIAAIDLYGLGGLVFFGLTGEMPNRPGPDGVDLDDADAAVRRQKTLLADRHIDADLEAICLRALANDPTERQRSPDGLRLDLLSWRRREPIEWASPTLRRRLVLSLRRRPAIWALAGAAIVAMVGGAAGIVWMRMSAAIETERRLAEAELQNTRRVAQLELDQAEELAKEQARRISSATTSANMMLRRIRQSDPENRISEGWLTTFAAMESLLSRFLDPQMEGTSGLWTDRISFIRDILADADARGWTDHVDMLMWETGLGLWLVQTGQFDEGRDVLARNRASWEQKLQPDDIWLACIDVIDTSAALEQKLALSGEDTFDANAVREDLENMRGLLARFVGTRVGGSAHRLGLEAAIAASVALGNQESARAFRRTYDEVIDSQNSEQGG